MREALRVTELPAWPTRHLFWLLVLLLTGCAGQQFVGGPEIVKSPQDQRAYRYLELSNALRVVLVSDPESDKAAAALRVDAGTGDDPIHRQGLAHFLEHMLFMGTEKYPDVEEHMTFIRSHGGTPNAFTTTDNTTYFYDIDPDYLDASLDRFAQFFIAPLFTREFVDREIHAVDSEYSLKIQDDRRREMDVFRETINPAHPRAKLGVGNLQTLQGGDSDIRDDLLAFYDAHYSANLMTLVVLGREDLDTLQELVMRFEAVSNRNRQARVEAPILFLPTQLPEQISIVPIKERRELSMQFPLPAVSQHWRGKPLAYLANLLGHEGPGSPLSVLKRLGWVESLAVSSGGELYAQSMFHVQIRLSRQGLDNYRSVVGLIFDALDQIKQSGIRQWRFAEQQQLSAVAFRFLEKGHPIGTVLGLGASIQDYPVAEMLRGPYRLDDWKPGLIEDQLQYLRPGNMRLTVVHQGAETDRQSVWYQAPFRRDALDIDTINSWRAPSLAAQLQLPAANPYLPEDLELLPAAVDIPAVPMRIVAEDGLRLWHRQDDHFAVPRAARAVRVLSPAVGGSARAAVLNQLLLAMIGDELNETTYYAYLAGLQFSLGPHSRGFDIHIGGYHDRQDTLLRRIIAVLRAPTLDALRFDNIKADLQRGLANAGKEEPVRQLIRQIGPLLFQPSWDDEALLAELAAIDIRQLREFSRQQLAGIQIEALVYGNIAASEAREFANLLRKELLLEPDAAIETLRVVVLPSGDPLTSTLSVEHPDSGFLLYLQGSDDSHSTRAALLLSRQILASPFFEQLRTRQQLGYMLGVVDFPLYRVPGLAMYIQSPNSTPEGLYTAVQQFLSEMDARLDSYNAADFADHRAAVLLKLRERPRNLAAQARRYWSALSLQRLAFDDRERIAEAVEAIDLDNWREFFRDNILGEQRRALLMVSAGSNTDGALPPGLREIESPTEFRRQARFREFAAGSVPPLR